MTAEELAAVHDAIIDRLEALAEKRTVALGTAHELGMHEHDMSDVEHLSEEISLLLTAKRKLGMGEG